MNLVGEDFIFFKLIITKGLLFVKAILCLVYIRHNFGITIWFLNREERFFINIFQQKITFNFFSLVTPRKYFLAIQK